MAMIIGSLYASSAFKKRLLWKN